MVIFVYKQKCVSTFYFGEFFLFKTTDSFHAKFFFLKQNNQNIKKKTKFEKIQNVNKIEINKKVNKTKLLSLKLNFYWKVSFKIVESL